MASKGIDFKNLPKRKKAYLFLIISFFACVLGFSLKTAYAYYHQSTSFSLLATLIGDFDMGDGDINMMLYKQNDEGKYVRSYAVPTIGYKFDDSLTKCTIPCDTNMESSCYYSYDSINNNFSLTSEENVTCKFYFNKTSSNDVGVNIMREDVAGTYTYNSKNYSLSEAVPAFGYSYVGYTCDKDATVTYDALTKKFKVNTTTKNTCYVYFDNDGTSDITVKVFVQSKEGSTIYDFVDVIPANKIYELSKNKTSYCYDSTGASTGITPTYVDGYIKIDATTKQTCDVYLDLITE